MRCSVGLVVLVVALTAAAGAQAYDDALYPDLRGAWRRPGAAQWDPTKPSGLKQEAPLTPEYLAVFEANIQDQASGGQSYNPQAQCLPGGMPRVMIAYDPLEIIATPEVTYVRSDHLTGNRRIYTDGRAWPATLKPSFHGYSIGQWIDEDGDGRYDALEVETRGFKGPRIIDASGLPLHKDNATVVKERFFLDKADANLLHDRITTIDNALTRPWTVTRSYRRERNPRWSEEVCAEANNYLILGRDTYFLSADGKLMPTRKDQPPPDLRFFSEAPK
ncbi:MAG: hypothetical protein QOI12_3935 [Alphaproteobacteria bacterium]|jgi:hypothetical protein|nr:hypothetical protein [Alphaproteobacteria bacterium]